MWISFTQYIQQVNTAGKKQTHRYREQTSGYLEEREGGRGTEEYRGKERFIMGLYEIMFVKLLRIIKYYRI